MTCSMLHSALRPVWFHSIGTGASCMFDKLVFWNPVILDPSDGVFGLST